MKPLPDHNGTQFDELHALLDVARRLVSDLMSDPLIDRLLRAFLLLPPADREPILGVIEKDATWRRIVEQTEGATGIDVRPNPHASLYLHVLAPVDGPPIESQEARDRDVIRFGLETFAQLLPLFFQEGVHAQWTSAAREIVRNADGDLRRHGARLAREVLAMIGEVDPDALRPEA